MPKETRKIYGTVRTEAGVFGTGQEDELAAALSPSDVARLTKKGTIEGFDAQAAKVSAENAPDAKAAPAPKAK